MCGRLLPALAAARRRRARLVLHVHDIVRRVPRIWRLADLVLAASQAVADRLVGLRAHVVYPPVDPDPPAADAPWVAGGPVVGFVGRLEPRKGPLDLVRAAPAIRRGAPGTHVVMIGADPYGAPPDYVRAVLSGTDVEHVAWVDNAPGVMRHLDVLVLPSHEEPAGTVLAEAMAVGTPVVATAVDGLARDRARRRHRPAGRPGRARTRWPPPCSRCSQHRERMGAAAREHATRFHTAAYVEQVERLLAG